MLGSRTLAQESTDLGQESPAPSDPASGQGAVRRVRLTASSHSGPQGSFGAVGWYECTSPAVA
jgi:hypothetical protein